MEVPEGFEQPVPIEAAEAHFQEVRQQIEAGNAAVQLNGDISSHLVVRHDIVRIRCSYLSEQLEYISSGSDPIDPKPWLNPPSGIDREAIAKELAEVEQEASGLEKLLGLKQAVQDHRRELRSEREERFWRGKGTEIKVPKRAGMQIDWAAKTLAKHPRYPFEIREMAKILLAEQYDHKKPHKLTNNIKNLLARNRGPLSLNERLNLEGFQLQILPIKTKRGHDLRFIGLPPGSPEMSLEEALRVKKLTDSQLRSWAISLRKSEIQRTGPNLNRFYFDLHPKSVPAKVTKLLWDNKGQHYSRAEILDQLMAEDPGADPRKINSALDTALFGGSVEKRLMATGGALHTHKISTQVDGKQFRPRNFYMALDSGVEPVWDFDESQLASPLSRKQLLGIDRMWGAKSRELKKLADKWPEVSEVFDRYEKMLEKESAAVKKSTKAEIRAWKADERQHQEQVRAEARQQAMAERQERGQLAAQAAEERAAFRANSVSARSARILYEARGSQLTQDELIDRLVADVPNADKAKISSNLHQSIYNGSLQNKLQSLGAGFHKRVVGGGQDRVHLLMALESDQEPQWDLDVLPPPVPSHKPTSSWHEYDRLLANQRSKADKAIEKWHKDEERAQSTDITKGLAWAAGESESQNRLDLADEEAWQRAVEARVAEQSGAEVAEAEQLRLEEEAQERTETERRVAEVERLENERLEAERLEAERQESERQQRIEEARQLAEKARLEAKHREAEARRAEELRKREEREAQRRARAQAAEVERLAEAARQRHAAEMAEERRRLITPADIRRAERAAAERQRLVDERQAAEDARQANLERELQAEEARRQERAAEERLLAAAKYQDEAKKLKTLRLDEKTQTRDILMQTLSWEWPVEQSVAQAIKGLKPFIESGRPVKINNPAMLDQLQRASIISLEQAQSGELDIFHAVRALVFRTPEGRRALSDNATRLRASYIIDRALRGKTKRVDTDTEIERLRKSS